MLQLQVEAVLASLQQLDEEMWHQTYTGILYARDNRKPGTYICIAKKYMFRIYTRYVSMSKSRAHFLYSLTGGGT